MSLRLPFEQQNARKRCLRRDLQGGSSPCRRVRPGLGRLLLCFIVLGFAGCSQPVFYSSSEIETLLAERYGLTFTVGDCRSADEDQRIYPVACVEFPELTFEAVDVRSPPGWSGGSGGVPPLPHGSSHALLDSFRTVSWNRYAAPLLAQYEIAGLEVPEAQRFYGVDYFSGAVREYPIRLADDPNVYIDELFALLTRLDSLPAFQTYRGDDSTDFPAYGIPVQLTVADGIGNTTEHLRLAVGYGYEKEELAELLAALRRTVRNNLKREMERSGVLACALERVESPAIGVDFYFLEDSDGLAFFRTCAAVSPSGGWIVLAALVREARGSLPETFSVYPAGRFADTVWYCVAEPLHEEDGSPLRFCIAPETGAVWQYAPCRGDAFLVDTGSVLPPETLDAVSQLSIETAANDPS